MAIKIMVDAAHCKKENQSPCNPLYWESLMAWNLQNHLKPALERCGFEVGQTRKSEEECMTIYERGTKAAGYDLFLSLHSNSTEDNLCNKIVDRVILIHYLFANEADKGFAMKLGNCIKAFVKAQQNTELNSKQGKNGEYYGILRGAKSVGCPRAYIVEHSFHTNPTTVYYLLPENGFLPTLAEEECKVICKEYDFEYIPPVKKQSKEVSAAESSLEIGCKVQLLPGAVYITGRAVPKRQIGKIFTVWQTQPGRVLIKKLCYWVETKYLKEV